VSNANLEPRIEQVEIDITELKRSILDLRSTVSTLADVVSLHENQHKESRQRFDRFVQQAEADRASMLQLIQALAQPLRSTYRSVLQL
jgi:predicted  nucleic acid-binding Zn-ribbon protein